MSEPQHCGVIEKATGDLECAGYCDFTGQFDSETREQRTDVPVPAKIRNQAQPGGVVPTHFHRWSGSAWTEVAFE